MTVEREQEPSNSAFVSYRSPYRRVAERLQRSLYRIADRHEEQRGEFRVFLDSSALKPGPLRENVYSALRRSHHLVVLLDAHTATSDWVSDEITHWLGNGGHADRLFLVRVDPDADLGWDGERLTNAAAVPAPLRELFREEPKWIDFRPRRLLGPDQAGLAGLCGALMDADVEQFGLVEAANQRDQVRTRTRLAGVMAVLLVLAVVAAIFAYVNQSGRRRTRTRRRPRPTPPRRCWRPRAPRRWRSNARCRRPRAVTARPCGPRCWPCRRRPAGWCTPSSTRRPIPDIRPRPRTSPATAARCWRGAPTGSRVPPGCTAGT